MFDTILLIIIFSSFIAVLYIIISKFPKLALIRLDIIPKEQQILIRNKLITRRLRNKFTYKGIFIIKTIRPFWLNFTSLFWKIYSKILEKERHLQRLSMTQEEQEEAKKKIVELLAQAAEANKNHLFMRAERLYINVISLDTKNLDAYDGLAQMYLTQKDYKKAKETIKYLLNIAKQKRKNDSKVKLPVADLEKTMIKNYSELGWLCQYQGDEDGALENFLAAAKMDENNPKILDQLLEISIIVKDIELAKETLGKIKIINPENQKIIEWERQIDDLLE